MYNMSKLRWNLCVSRYVCEMLLVYIPSAWQKSCSWGHGRHMNHSLGIVIWRLSLHSRILPCSMHRLTGMFCTAAQPHLVYISSIVRAFNKNQQVGFLKISLIFCRPSQGANKVYSLCYLCYKPSKHILNTSIYNYEIPKIPYLTTLL